MERYITSDYFSSLVLMLRTQLSGFTPELVNFTDRDHHL